MLNQLVISMEVNKILTHKLNHIFKMKLRPKRNFLLKLLEENTVDYFYNLWIGNDLLTRMQSNKVIKRLFAENKGKPSTDKRYSSHTLKDSYQKCQNLLQTKRRQTA